MIQVDTNVLVAMAIESDNLRRRALEPPRFGGHEVVPLLIVYSTGCSPVGRAAAEERARSVNDDGRFGTWRYLFCSEAAIKRARGGWDGLLVASQASA